MNKVKLFCLSGALCSFITLCGAEVIQTRLQIADKNSSVPPVSYQLVRRAEAITDLKVLPFERGNFTLQMDDKNIYLTFILNDSDMINEAGKIQLPMHKYGDAIQLILKPTEDTFFWEFSIAPTGLWNCFFYNGPGSMVSKKEIDLKPEIKITPQGSVNNISDRDTGWKVEAAVPVSAFNCGKYKFDENTAWDALIVRYNFSRYLNNREISSFPQTTKNTYNFNRAAHLVFPGK